MKNHPKSLYKYLPYKHTEDFLKKKLIRFSPIGEFNDLFEGRPKITGINKLNEPTIYLGDKADHIPSTSAIEEIYNLIPNDVRPLITYGELMLMARYKQNFSQNDKGIQLIDAGDFAIQFITRKIDEKIGALCLSEVPNSLLMWGHYGEQHAGVVIEFDGHHPYFHQTNNESEHLNQIYRVIYRDSRPEIYLKEPIAADLFLTKSSHWAYECEWRILKSLSDADVAFEEKTKSIHLFSIPPEAISGIILGARANKNNYLSLKEIINSDKTLGHITLKRILADSTHYHLLVSDVDEQDFNLKLT